MRHVHAAIRRADAARGDPYASHEQILFDEGTLRDLVHRQERLARLHARIEAAHGRDCERLWQRFFLCYDDFIQALHHAPPGVAPRSGQSSVTPARARR